MIQILIVDDVALMCKVIHNIVGNFGACEIATSGRSALDLFHSRFEKQMGFQVVFLDINMPETDGYKLLGQIREFESQHQVEKPSVIIMLSAISDTYNKDKAFIMGANDFISKPMKKSSLVETLEKFGFSDKPQPAP